MSVNKILAITYCECIGTTPISPQNNCSLLIEFDENISPHQNYENIQDNVKGCILEIFVNVQLENKDSYFSKFMNRRKS